MNPGRLAGEVVIVTGASSGIGRAVARELSDAGAKVVLVARREDRLEALVTELKGESCVVVADVRDTEKLIEQLERLPDAFHPPTALINNAGLALGQGKVQEADPADWDVMLDTNVRALIKLTRWVLPKMIANKKGTLIQVGSVAGNWPYPGGHVYCATKAFVRQFSLAIRSDLLGTPIRVTNIEPGRVETDFSLVRYKGDEGEASAVYEGYRSLMAEDVARTIVWCLEQPPHVTISTLEIVPTDQALSGFTMVRPPEV